MKTKIEAKSNNCGPVCYKDIPEGSVFDWRMGMATATYVKLHGSHNTNAECICLAHCWNATTPYVCEFSKYAWDEPYCFNVRPLKGIVFCGE